MKIELSGTLPGFKNTRLPTFPWPWSVGVETPTNKKKSKESSLINKHPNSVWDRAPHLETGEDLYNFWNVEKWRITFLSQKCMSMSFEMSSKRTHPKQTVFQQTGKYLKFSKHNKIISFHSNRFFFHSEITWTKFWPFLLDLKFLLNKTWISPCSKKYYPLFFSFVLWHGKNPSGISWTIYNTVQQDNNETKRYASVPFWGAQDY